jgi:DNA polymerase I
MPLLIGGRAYSEWWDIDFEFNPREVVCLTAHEQLTGRRLQFTCEQLLQMREAPFPRGRDVLVSGYGLAAEAECFLRLGWPLFENAFDLYAVHRRLTNGLVLRGAKPNSLIGALSYYGEEAMEHTAKETWRKKILSGEWREDVAGTLRYNKIDVESDAKLHPHFLSQLNDPLTWRRVLYDGEGMKAWAHVQIAGVPLNTELLSLLRECWEDIKLDLITEVDNQDYYYNGSKFQYHCYDGASFRLEKFENLLRRHGIGWPRSPKTNRAKKDAETLRDMSDFYTFLRPLRQLISTINDLRLTQLAVGPDGRNRVSYNVMGTITGRCIMNNTEDIFNVPAWLRHLIRPPEGRSLLHFDFGQEEFAIGAYESGCEAMIRAYESGDPYKAFARRAGAVREGMTDKQIQDMRDRYKTATLAMNYEIGAHSLAARIGVTLPEARDFIEQKRRAFPRHAAWVNAVVAHGRKHKVLYDVAGFPLHIVSGTNRRTIGNFPVQACGFQILRRALMRLIRRGVMVVATAHDSITVECDIADAGDVRRLVLQEMVEASREFLDGRPLRVDVMEIRHPDHYVDKKGYEFWLIVESIVNRLRGVSTQPTTSDLRGELVNGQPS